MVELEEIKKTVSKKEVFEQMTADPLPHEIVDLEKMIEETPEVAPVFIKMDRYKDILQRIHGLKSSIDKIETVLRVRKDMHDVNKRSDEMLEKSFQEFAEATNDFKREFVVARKLPFLPEEGKVLKQDQHITKLSSEIVKLRDELDNLEI